MRIVQWWQTVFPRDGFFYPILTRIMGSFPCSPLSLTVCIGNTMKKASRKSWIRWVATWWRHFNSTMGSLIDVPSACDQHAAVSFFLYLSNGLVRICETNRIHHWCSVGTEKSQPEGWPFQWKTRLAEFPTERWTWGLEFFWNHWTPMIDSFSHISRP